MVKGIDATPESTREQQSPLDSKELSSFLECLVSDSEPARTRIIAIDGPSGAGKTSLSLALSDELSRKGLIRPQVVSMDDLYPGWGGLLAGVDLVAELVLEPLSRGVDGRFRRWDWLRNQRGEEVLVPAKDWFVLEGVGSGARKCRPHLAGLIWLEAEKPIRYRRTVQRDGEAMRAHWNQWAQQEDTLFLHDETRDSADVIIDTSLFRI